MELVDDGKCRSPRLRKASLRSLKQGLGRLLGKRCVTITEYDPTYKVAYLGNVLTGWARGEQCVEKPLNTLWKNYLSNSKPKVPMKIIVSQSGLKAVTKEHGLTEYWSHRITYCRAPDDYPKIFCWVYRHEGRKLKQELRCHAVLCSKERTANAIASRLRASLTRALIEFKRDKISRQNARLSLANSVYDNPSLPRRKIMLSTASHNYRPPLERSKSAPKLTSIEECLEEEEENVTCSALRRCDSRTKRGIYRSATCDRIKRIGGLRMFRAHPIEYSDDELLEPDECQFAGECVVEENPFGAISSPSPTQRSMTHSVDDFELETAFEECQLEDYEERASETTSIGCASVFFEEDSSSSVAEYYSSPDYCSTTAEECSTNVCSSVFFEDDSSSSVAECCSSAEYGPTTAEECSTNVCSSVFFEDDSSSSVAECYSSTEYSPTRAEKCLSNVTPSVCYEDDSSSSAAECYSSTEYSLTTAEECARNVTPSVCFEDDSSSSAAECYSSSECSPTTAEECSRNVEGHPLVNDNIVSEENKNVGDHSRSEGSRERKTKIKLLHVADRKLSDSNGENTYTKCGGPRARKNEPICLENGIWGNGGEKNEATKIDRGLINDCNSVDNNNPSVYNENGIVCRRKVLFEKGTCDNCDHRIDDYSPPSARNFVTSRKKLFESIAVEKTQPIIVKRRSISGGIICRKEVGKDKSSTKCAISPCRANFPKNQETNFLWEEVSDCGSDESGYVEAELLCPEDTSDDKI